MKLSPRDATRYFARPDPERPGLLIYGQDAMRVALKRQEVIAALIGPEGEAEMRLTRFPAGELVRDKTILMDAMRETGFFPGPRVVFVEDANDRAAPMIDAALAEWQQGDAVIVVTAGALRASSKLRKAFETHSAAYAAAIYDDPPGRDEIEAELRKAGIGDIDRDAMAALIALAHTVDPGDLRQTIEKLALYTLESDRPVSAEDVSECAPVSTEADLDDVLNVVAEGRAAEIGPVMSKLHAQGVQPVSLCIGATRHFRTLYTAASDPGGAAAGVAKLRPPIYGPRRDRIARQASKWGAPNLERALTMLTDTDLQLRSAGQRAPAMALVERTLIRLAMLGAR